MPIWEQGLTFVQLNFMIKTFRNYFLLIICLVIAVFGEGQAISSKDTVKIPHNYKPEFKRLLNHEAIEREQKAIFASDGTADLIFSPSNNIEINFLLTRVLTEKAPLMQYQIETDKVLDHRLKVNYLKGLENILYLNKSLSS